jgi:hypothetical protein
MAWHHAELIKDDKKINHGLWGGAYVILLGLVSWGVSNIYLFFAGLMIRKIVFDISLNLFRGKAIFYVSKTTTSLVDKFHNKVFGNSPELYQSFYLVKLILLNIFLL